MNTHASFNESDESIECCKSNIKLIVNMITFGKGTLYVTESKLYWKNNANSQVISINYDIMCKYDVSHYPGRHKKSCLKMIVDYNYKPDEFDQNEDEEKEKFKSIIKLVPDNPECLNAIFEAIACIQPLHFSDNIVDEESESDEHEDSDKNSNASITLTCTQKDQEAGSIGISNQYHKLDEKNEKNGEKENQVNSIECVDLSNSPSDSLDDNEYSHVQPLHFSDNVDNEESKSDEHEDSDKNSNASITLTCTQKDQEAGSIGISNQYHKLDEKNGEKENQVNSIECVDLSNSPSDSLDDNEYSHVQPLHFSDNVDNEESKSDEHEDSDKNSNASITLTCTQKDQEAGSIGISNQYHKLDEKNGEKENQVNSIECVDLSNSPSDSLDDNEYSHVQPLHFSDNVDNEESESDEHEDSDKNSNTSTISSTCTQKDQEAGSIGISNQYHKLDEKNGEKENRVNSIECIDLSHSPSDSLDDNEYSHDSENDDLELNNTKSPNVYFNILPRAPLHSDMDLATEFENDILLQDEEVLIRSPTSYFKISSRAPLHPDMDLSTEFENDILLQDEEVLFNKRKRKFEDSPEQEEKSTKIRKLWNFMKYPFKKITLFNSSIRENESNISIDEVTTEAIAGKKNYLEPETAVCENNSDSVKPEENNSEADGENEDTSINETSQKVCKIM